MAIHIEENFTVEAPRAQVWAYFRDPLQVVLCLPGASITEAIDERTYRGLVQVQVGPISARYQGSMEIETMDADAGTLIMVVRAAQIGAVGRVEGRITCQIAPLADNITVTEVSVRAELQVTGRLMQLAGGLINTVARQVFGQFSACAQRAILARSNATNVT